MGVSAIKKLIISILVLSLFVGIANIPEIILEKSIKVKYIRPVQQTIATKISGSGKILSTAKSEIYTDTPVYTDEVYYCVGDRVEKGAVLADINTDKTLNILTSSSPLETNINKICEVVSKLPNPDMLYLLGNAYGIAEKDIDELFKSAKYTTSEKKISYIQPDIISPINGVITEINISENVLSQSNAPAIVVCNTDETIAVVKINQEYAKKIDIGMSADVFDENFQTKGVVSQISPIASENQIGRPTVDVTIKLENDNNFKIGYCIEAEIDTSSNHDVLTLPVAAIRQDGLDEYVYTITNGIAEKKKIIVGDESAYCSEVISGISQDDLIIISNKEIKDKQRLFIEGELINEKRPKE
ncbi:MAG: efflux RND transporter periplasmic adaptor subunit [Oscillospiraceae bacterium]